MEVFESEGELKNIGWTNFGLTSRPLISLKVWNPVLQRVEWKDKLHHGVAGCWNPVLQKVASTEKSRPDEMRTPCLRQSEKPRMQQGYPILTETIAREKTNPGIGDLLSVGL